MSTRDELARILAICDDYDGCFERVDEWEATPEDERRDDDYPASDYEDCQWWLRRADAALAAGWIRADSEEWGARLGDASGVSRMPGEFQAQTLAELPNWVAVRRSVGHGPWEVA